ncbi:MAG: hypothetical protein ACJA01_002486 [Saprospiraceae bacterium]|jgi:hypothetical protein
MEKLIIFFYKKAWLYPLSECIFAAPLEILGKVI